MGRSRTARWRQGALTGALGAGLFLGVDSCREPTQVTLEITYNGACADLQRAGIAILVGNDPLATEARVQSDFFTATTTVCENGRIGTLVVTPSEGSGRGVVVVIAGLDRTPQECDPSNGFFGCIVARRSFSFVDHTRLIVPILLDLNCKNVPCDAVSTCKAGACVSSEARCAGERCDDFGVATDGGTVFVDAPTRTDPVSPPPDGSPADAPPDAPRDAPSDGPSGSCPKQPMTCPPNGAACTVGQTCCWRPPEDFTPTDGAVVPLRLRSCDPALGACGNPYTDYNTYMTPSVTCRGARNCGGADEWCCAPPAPVTSCGTSCVFGPPDATPNIVCQVDCECPPNMFCDTSEPYLFELFRCKLR